MMSTLELWIIIAIALICIDFFLITRLLLGRVFDKRKQTLNKEQKNYLVRATLGNKLEKRKKLDIINYYNIHKVAKFDAKVKVNINSAIDLVKSEKKYIRNLPSFFKTKRAESAFYLGTIASKRAKEELEKALLNEKSSTIKLYIANALSDIHHKTSIPVLVQSIVNEGRFYRDKVNMLIAEFEDDFYSYLPQIMQSKRIELKELIVDFSATYYAENLRNYLIQMVDTMEEEKALLRKTYSSETCCKNCIHATSNNETESILCKFKGVVKATFWCRHFEILPVSINSETSYERLVVKACDILAEFYPVVLDHPDYLDSKNVQIRNIAVRALVNFHAEGNFDKLVRYLKQEETVQSAANALSILLEKNPVYYKRMLALFLKEKDCMVKKEYAKILSLRIEYYIMKLPTDNKQQVEDIIKEILLAGRTSEFIDFLSKNKDIDLENDLLEITKAVSLESEKFKLECEKYLPVRILEKCGFKAAQEDRREKEISEDSNQKRQLAVLLTCSVLFAPIIYAVRHFGILFEESLLNQLKLFVVDFNYYIAFYAMAVNLVYLLLMLLSFVSVYNQEMLWNLKDMNFLFKKKMLPTISIIAPAYNEERTIIESANSLLNLKYPDYELVIVNDGSKDNTLQTLIHYFDLKRIDYLYQSKIPTEMVRGIYLNRSRPKLIVVDKVNGGKADSLNVGINIAKNEYICGIDADSLLEDDALLKLVSLTLDEEMETPALGGNILPVNGCVVEFGEIVEKHLPKNRLAKFQMMEYIRAFMSGRLGWSFLNSLLIISGAFGIFRKERVIGVGGYLTSKGRYNKNTVGEDMELVVRITRQMKEKKNEFKILYAYNANCWTEVPEDFATLKKQRYRWHRGLIEILTYHKKMLFNPTYEKIGMIAIPYFWIFEMLGPIFEMQGYFLVLVSIVFGLINYQVAIILFVSSVLLGVLISVFSLQISERNGRYFSTKELGILVLYAVIENFGVRQFFSLWRFGGYLNMFKKPVGWQKAERRGFTQKATEHEEGIGN